MTDPDGSSRFVDDIWPYDGSNPPFQMTGVLPATGIRFRWTPGDCDFDYLPAPRRQLVLVTEGGLEITVGSGETRVFRCGDVLSIADTWGQGHRSRAQNAEPFRSALIGLDDEAHPDRREPVATSEHLDVPYVHNQEDQQGLSFFTDKALPFQYGEPEGQVTNEIRLSAFQFVLAPPDLDYSWHPAPQRQIVLVLTGGLAMEYGNGSHRTVSPGGFLLGEDTHGKGHITRALDGTERLSVFAHLIPDSV